MKTMTVTTTEKCAMIIMRCETRLMTEGIELPNKEKLELSEKRKLTRTWECWKQKPSNKKR